MVGTRKIRSMFGGFKVEKCEIQCRLGLGRIKLQRNKRVLQLKQSRKDVSELLKTGKQEYARIRVEGVIREQLMLQAYEILELYLELMTVRAQLISKTKEIPRDMVEAVSSIIYSAQRIGDIPEIQALGKMFEAKYGKEYCKEASSDATCSKWQVNQNLINCLLVEAPPPDVKLAMLSEIAQEYGVEWDASLAAREMLPPPAGGPAAAFSAPPPQGGYGVPTPPQGGYGAPPPGGYGGGAPAPHLQYGSAPLPQAAYNGGPPPAGLQYADAHQAAAAASHAASQAKAAADYAAQFAMYQAGLPVAAAPAASPPSGWLGQAPPLAPPLMPVVTHPPGADDHSDSGSVVQASPPHAVHYGTRSDEEIQRAYDEAQGPPSKIEKPPSAPLPPPEHHGPPPPPPPQPFNAAPPPPQPFHSAPPPPQPFSAAPPAFDSQGLSLPAPPKSSPSVPDEPEDEYTALTRRLDALKKS